MGEIMKMMLIPMLTGSVAMAVLTACRRLTERHFSPKWHYYVWLILILVTVLPVRINIDLPKKSTGTENIILGELPQTAELTHSGANAVNMPPQTVTEITEAEPEINIGGLFASVWAAGFGAMLLARLISYGLFVRKVHKCPKITLPKLGEYTKRRITVRKCPFCPSPMLIGIFRLTLLLPDTELSEAQLDSILAHETVHLKRGDIHVKWLVMAVRCVHWYSPLIHFAARRLDDYCEISCDIEAVRPMDEAGETAYMMTILSLAAGRSYAFGLGLSDEAKSLKRRFTMIKTKQKISRKTKIISLVCALSLLCTTIFVSGVLANDATRESENISVYLHGREIELKNKPFVADNTLYLPIREMLNLENIPNEDITYFKGYVTFLTPDGKGDKYVGRVLIGSEAAYIGGYSHGTTENTVMAKPPVLRDCTTYVPYDYFFKMKAVGLFEDFYAEVFDEDGRIPLITGVGIWNEEKNFSLELPLALHNDFIVTENEDSVVFSNDKGTLFTVHIKANEGETVKSEGYVMSENGLTYSVEGGILADEMVEYIRKSLLPIVYYIPLGDATDHVLILYPCESADYRKIASRTYSESHPAIDLVYKEGTNVVASISGTVTEQGFDADKGNYVVISNGTAEILYAHLKDVFVKQGDRVTQGDVIGTVGSTGKSTGPHLHFEIIINDKNVDPTEVWTMK